MSDNNTNNTNNTNNNNNNNQQDIPLIGELGVTTLLQTLTSSSNPLQSIVTFRNENELKSIGNYPKKFLPAIELHDLQGKPRRDLYKDILNHFLNIILENSKNLSQEQRLKLLHSCFPYIGFKELQKIPFALLEQTKDIPSAYLYQISIKNDLYEQAPLSVQQQIWRLYPKLFLKRIQPIFDSFIKNKCLSINSYDYYITSRLRREKIQELQLLYDLIGDSFELYKQVIEYCTILFIKTGCVHYCSLRSDLLLYYRDCNQLSIFLADPSSKFAGLLDSLGVSNLTIEKTKGLCLILTETSSGSSLRLDYAMLLSDISIQNIFIKNIYNCLISVVDNLEDISDFRTHENVYNYTCCLDLGLSAFKIVKSCDFKKHLPSGKSLFISFYGQLIHRIVDDKLREPSDSPPELSNEFIKSFFKEPVARKIILYYTVERAKVEDILSLKQLLKVAAGLEDKINKEQVFIHSLISQTSLVKSDKLQQVIIDEFLIPFNRYTNVHIELLYFLMNANSRLESNILLNYLNIISQYRTNDINEANYILPFANMFIERLTSRITKLNAEFFFEYIDQLKNPCNNDKMDEDINTNDNNEDKDDNKSQQIIKNNESNKDNTINEIELNNNKPENDKDTIMEENKLTNNNKINENNQVNNTKDDKMEEDKINDTYLDDDITEEDSVEEINKKNQQDNMNTKNDDKMEDN